MDNTTLYNEVEAERIERMQSLRDKITTDLLSKANVNADIDSAKSIYRLVNEIFTSQEASIHKTAENRTRYAGAANSANIQQSIVELFKAVATKNATGGYGEGLEDISSLSDDDIVYGEMEINAPNISDEFYENDEDEDEEEE